MNEEIQEPITIQEIIVNRMNLYEDILDNSDITSDEHKEAVKNDIRLMETFIKANEIGSQNELAKLKYEEEKKKEKRDLYLGIVKIILEGLAIAAPLVVSLKKQERSQSFAARQMNRLEEWELTNTARTTTEKTCIDMMKKDFYKD